VRQRHQRPSRDSGSATVEVVIATPLLTLLLLLVVQFGVWAHATHIAQAAANQGLQTARAYRGSEAAGEVDARAFLDQAAGTLLINRGVTVTRSATTVTVSITGTAATVMPGFRLPVRTTATGPVERLAAFPSARATVDKGWIDGL
jgi:Flp pilus assembly protein TadG